VIVPVPSEIEMPPTILVCDNEEPLRALVRATLESVSYTIVEARDGDEAIARARELKPDLILLDMMMPGRSGIDVLEELRAEPELAATPVVMLTARTQAADREAAAGAGVNRFVAKPFSPRELAAIVESELADRP
jgi:CheY-like chemotaxis protein